MKIIETNVKKEYFIQSLIRVAEADGVIQDEEMYVLKNVSNGFGVDINKLLKNKKSNSVDLSLEEKIFILREMYRVSTANGEIKDSEVSIIESFCLENKIDSEIKNATEAWANKTLDAEIEYVDFLNNYL